MSAIRLGPKLKELRFHMCQTSATSLALRKFIENNYVSIKKVNPNFPILIRECSGIMPKIWARYEFGKEKSFEVGQMSSEDIFKLVSKLETNKV
uniref:NADH dehydrogenase [ubiquinone] 1 alpha subcomplex subunit 2 n=1 Tax=Romanomermis culicivorax TaxID=13658 RepID=A0A915IZJ2_ROMCU